MSPKLISLRSAIGGPQTLVIACHECDMEQEGVEGMYFYTTLGNMLHRYDFLQQDIIRHHIEEKGCTQIVVCGHLHCGILDHLLHDKTSRSALASLQFNLAKLLGSTDQRFILPEIRKQILVELNIIQQCNLLMEYDFIRDRVTEGTLKVIGVMITADNQVNQIYSDGFDYNNLISLN